MSAIKEAMARMLDRAEESGRAAGKAAGSWVVDGNTSEATARRLIEMDSVGDPAFYEECPESPLSGEFADGPTLADVCSEAGLYTSAFEGGDREYLEGEIAEAFEQGFTYGWAEEVIRSAHALID